MHACSTLSRLLRGGVVPIAALATMLAVSACAAGNAPVAAAPQDRSPLAAPPASMMTPHGY